MGRLRQNLTWPILIGIGAATVAANLLNGQLMGWGHPGSIALVVVLIVVFGYRQLWPRPSFWLRMIVILAIQLPLVRLARPYVYAYKLIFNWAFAMADLMLAIIIIQAGRHEPQNPPPEP